ncbi:F-box/LRR-repeat protein 13-like [Bidens hawaiensis]|uniref:F-box/LRR-repeat protein 13-like n=1 Tax=Bidens hawaiensis TaxID=980011 RepID=UPI00404B4D08
MADMLANLPECLQLRILSCLDTRHVVQTTLLSKSWFSSWTCTPVLSFSSNGFENLDVFDNFVVNVLSNRQPVKLDKITFKRDGKDVDLILQKVFDYTFLHGVQELEVDIDYIKSWPIGLHTSSDSLKSLKFAGYSFFEPISGSFKNLTNLHLKRATITDLDPFLGFPALYKLRLDFCFLRTKGKVLNVNAAQLSEFTLLGYSYVKRCEFTTPKLRYFEWRGGNFPNMVAHEGGFPILDTVVIDYNGYWLQGVGRKMFDNLLMLFNTLHNARSLKVFSPVVHLLTLFPVNGHSPFRDLKCLELDFSSFCNEDLFELVSGLKDYLLPKSRDAKCNVMVINSLRPQAIAFFESAFAICERSKSINIFGC